MESLDWLPSHADPAIRERLAGMRLEAGGSGAEKAIAKALADQGRVGVPLYLVYGKGGGAPAVLPQLLTSGMVAQALDAAANPHS